MYEEPKAVREIHEIRARLYEEQKNWTPKQRVDHLRRVGNAMAKKLGLTVVQAPVRLTATRAAAKSPRRKAR